MTEEHKQRIIKSHIGIDHIVPIDFYLKKGITDMKIINGLNNLQPLWAKDNLKKGNRLSI